MTIRSIGLVIKHNHAEAAALAADMTRFILSRGKKVVFASESKKLALHTQKTLPKALRPSDIRIVEKSKMMQACDLILVLGGDGTFVSIARLMRDKSVPVLGVNMGTLGFLTEVKKTEAFQVIGAILSGKKPKINERALLEVTLKRKGRVIFQGPVVNDAVISKGAIARIITIQVYIEGKLCNTVRADGIIVGTPTGSTAYSLAAGGPIIDPGLSALVLAPICPHSLTQRPIVIPDRCLVELKLTQRPGHVFLTLDGQDAVDLREDDVISVRRFKKHSLKLIPSPSRDYYGLLREKLKFG